MTRMKRLRLKTSSPVKSKLPFGQCPFCRSYVEAESRVVKCSVCETVHHEDCWNSNRKCSVFGCGSKQRSLQKSRKKKPPVTKGKPGRNDACACGSSLKYKDCCLNRDVPVARFVKAPSRRNTKDNENPYLGLHKLLHPKSKD